MGLEWVSCNRGRRIRAICVFYHGNILYEWRILLIRVEAAPVRRIYRGPYLFEIWIVVTDDPAEAIGAVRAMVPAGANVEAIYDRPSDETLKRLALVPGQAWLL